MKHYQSLTVQQNNNNKETIRNNKFQTIKNNSDLYPIMEYDYSFQQPIKKIDNKNNSKNKQIINKPSSKINQQNKNKIDHKNKLIYATQSQQNSHKQNHINKNTKQFNTNADKKITKPTQIHQKSQKPQKSPKILTQHNPTTYSSTLFPQSQSIKQQLKQNLQQEMLTNYYINKYSTIMSKITNQNIKIQLPSDITQRTFSNSKDNQSLLNNKKRKNFKQLIKSKTINSQKQIQIQQQDGNDNQSKINTKNKNNYQTQMYINEGDKNKNRNQPLNITFSPIKYPIIEQLQAKNQSKQKGNNQNINENQKYNKNIDQKLSSRRSNHSRESSKSHSNKEKSVNKFSSQNQRQNQDSLRESQKIRQSSHSFKTNNFQSRSISPQNRKNFKQSLKEKKSLHLEYEQNYDLYKKLQSSIIDQLYSPSPRKIEKDKFNEITFVNRQMTKEEKKILKLKESQGIKDFYDEGFQNIEINQNESDLDQSKIDTKRQSHQKYNDTKAKQIDLLRQSIRKSIQSNRNRSEISPQKYEKNQIIDRKQSPSRKSPNDSPQRSFISNKNKQLSSEGQEQQLQKQQKWNPNFNLVKSHNKKYLNVSSNPRRFQYSPTQSPNRQQRKYYSLEKTYHLKNGKISPQKILPSRQKNNDFSHQKYPINEQENDFQSDPENNLQTTMEHNESYNEVAKMLGNSIDITEDAQNHVSFKPHQRKGSFHSVRSDRNHRNHQPIQSRFIVQNFQNSRNSNQTVNEPSEQQDDDVQFVAPANDHLFSQKGSERSKSKHSSPVRKNLIETVDNTRSRRPSQHFSFISDSNSHHDFSMLSRFSMTSEEGSMIVQKLENEITQNQFGPYQYALESLRQLLYEHKTAWPIYVVGQKILEDRAQYEKKIELQGRMLEDYKQKIVEMKRKQEKNENETDQLELNKLRILRLVREICSEQ